MDTVMTLSEMEAKRLLSSIKKVSAEIVTQDELYSLIKEGNVTAYIGYEPSNLLHIGSLVACSPLLLLAKHGFKCKILLADVHAWLNGKGELEELREIGEQNEKMLRKVCKAFGVDPELIEFVYGSDYQFSKDYIKVLLQFSQHITASKARKAMDMISKKEVSYKVSSEIYALMQCIDIFYLKVNVAIGGTDQRKIHMMARDYLHKINYIKPVAIHTPILLGIDGKQKMSKSLNNAIFLNDPPEQIEHKIRKAYCPEGSPERNMVFDILQYIILSWEGSIEVNGTLYSDMSAVLNDWIKKRITAKMLKDAVTEALIRILKRMS